MKNVNTVHFARRVIVARHALEPKRHIDPACQGISLQVQLLPTRFVRYIKDPSHSLSAWHGAKGRIDLKSIRHVLGKEAQEVTQVQQTCISVQRTDALLDVRREIERAKEAYLVAAVAQPLRHLER